MSRVYELLFILGGRGELDRMERAGPSTVCTRRYGSFCWVKLSTHQCIIIARGLY